MCNYLHVMTDGNVLSILVYFYNNNNISFLGSRFFYCAFQNISHDWPKIADLPWAMVLGHGSWPRPGYCLIFWTTMSFCHLGKSWIKIVFGCFVVINLKRWGRNLPQKPLDQTAVVFAAFLQSQLRPRKLPSDPTKILTSQAMAMLVQIERNTIQRMVREIEKWGGAPASPDQIEYLSRKRLRARCHAFSQIQMALNLKYLFLA